MLMFRRSLRLTRLMRVPQGEGLGKTGHGRTSAIKQVRKQDNSGIGSSKATRDEAYLASQVLVASLCPLPLTSLPTMQIWPTRVLLGILSPYFSIDTSGIDTCETCALHPTTEGTRGLLAS